MESRSGKDPDAGKDWGQEEKGATEDEMVGWHHQLNGHEFEQTLGDSEGQGSLACCSSGLQRVESLNNSNGLLSSMVSVNNSPLCSHGLFPLLCNQLPFRENSSTPCPYWNPLPQAKQHPPHQPLQITQPCSSWVCLLPELHLLLVCTELAPVEQPAVHRLFNAVSSIPCLGC